MRTVHLERCVVSTSNVANISRRASRTLRVEYRERLARDGTHTVIAPSAPVIARRRHDDEANRAKDKPKRIIIKQ
jgi:hypothetical protein